MSDEEGRSVSAMTVVKREGEEERFRVSDCHDL